MSKIEEKKHILDYEEAVYKLDEIYASLYFILVGIEDDELAQQALRLLRNTLSEASDEIKELFNHALELQREKTNDQE